MSVHSQPLVSVARSARCGGSGTVCMVVRYSVGTHVHAVPFQFDVMHWRGGGCAGSVVVLIVAQTQPLSLYCSAAFGPVQNGGVCGDRLRQRASGRQQQHDQGSHCFLARYLRLMSRE